MRHCIKDSDKILSVRNFYLFLLGVEVLSFISHQILEVHVVALVIILTGFILLAWKNLSLVVVLLYLELFVSSKGYLFWFDIKGFQISIRLLLFLSVFVIGFYQLVIKKYIKTKELPLFFQNKSILIAITPFFFFLLVGILLGVIKNQKSALFFDANGYLYFAIIFIVYEIFSNKKQFQILVHAFTAAILWIFTKTYFLLFIFSHKFELITPIFYSWVRDTGVGELTRLDDNFYRIFFQSHIYAVIGFFAFLLFLISRDNLSLKNFFKGNISNKMEIQRPFILTAFSLLMIIVSFSRSFWVTTAFLLLCLLVYLFYCTLSKQLSYPISIAPLKFIQFFLLITITSVGLILVNINLPIEKFTSSSYFTGELIRKRVEKLNLEPAVSSRWSQLPVIIGEIKKSPFWGHGFGKTLTYKSSDPRNLEKNPEGWYTTYAFEWGYLDIVLKIGVFGLISYIWYLFIILYQLWKKSFIKSEDALSAFIFIFAVLSVAVTHFFTPYLNHPLGIGVLMLATTLSFR